MLEAAAAAADHLFDTGMCPYNFCLTASSCAAAHDAADQSNLTVSPSLTNTRMNCTLLLIAADAALFLSTDPYSKIALANSISLVAVDGNNYTEEHLVYIKRVVARITYNSQRLYDLGLQDVMVYNLVPPNFTPHYTQKYNYNICDTSVDPSAQIHNGLLLSAVEKINTRNPVAHFIILDQYLAFGLSDGLLTCCQGLGNSSCADTDPATGKPSLHTVQA
ncbi:unnamed protein product [Sphagnum troendelagicum]|uniref:Uncharacterized protein n=1 Tax=Sphagnum troendelagicum TaxID=128251 RepID=A0ABP0V2F0_9BRYO